MNLITKNFDTENLLINFLELESIRNYCALSKIHNNFITQNKLYSTLHLYNKTNRLN